MSESCGRGIDIGGTRIKAVRVDASGQILKQLNAPTLDDVDALIATIGELVDQLGGEGPLGIASPGLAATDNRSIRWMQGRMEAVEGLVWGDALNQLAMVLNDAQAATLAEAWVGAAAGLQHVVMLTLGTGVGGGVIGNGQLLQGAIGRAGHLGHITLDLDGPLDILQTPGSLEDLIGNHSVKARTGFESTFKLVAAASQGDVQARHHWDRVLHALACGIVSLINAFDPQAVVIGGGIAEAGECELFKPLRKIVDRYEWCPLGQSVPILPATLGQWSGAVGAARFAMTQHALP